MNLRRKRYVIGVFLFVASWDTLSRAELPAQWCAAEVLEEQYVACWEGDCDTASTRNLWFPTTGSAKTKIRIKFIIFDDDGGGNAATNGFAVSQQVGELNDEFGP